MIFFFHTQNFEVRTLLTRTQLYSEMNIHYCIIFCQLIMHVTAWIRCGSPPTCFCEEYEIICKGDQIYVFPLFKTVYHRLTTDITIQQTRMERIYFNFTLWRALTTLTISENQYLIDCEVDRTKLLKTGGSRIRLYMSCHEKKNATTSVLPTSGIPDIDTTLDLSTVSIGNVTDIAINEKHSDSIWIIMTTVIATFITIFFTLLAVMLLIRKRRVQMLPINNPIYRGTVEPM